MEQEPVRWAVLPLGHCLLELRFQPLLFCVRQTGVVPGWNTDSAVADDLGKMAPFYEQEMEEAERQKNRA